MSKETKADLPSVKLATEDWVMKEMTDTERRIEKAFHEQTQYIGERTELIQRTFQERTDKLHTDFQDQIRYLGVKYDSVSAGIANQTRWMVGLLLTLIVALVAAVLFNG